MDEGQQPHANLDELQRLWNQAINAQIVTLQVYNTRAALSLIQVERSDAELCLQLLLNVQYQAQQRLYEAHVAEIQPILLQVQLQQQMGLQALQAADLPLLPEMEGMEQWQMHNLGFFHRLHTQSELCLQQLLNAQYQAQQRLRVAQAADLQPLLQHAELHAQQAANQALLAEMENMDQRQGVNFDNVPEIITESDDEDEEGENERIRQDVIQLRKQDDECAALGLRFSRACRVCQTEEPRERAACKGCGEAVCRECADAATDHQSCPKRREETGYVTIYEAAEERNEAGGLVRSRACTLCMAESPHMRCVFINCGHIVCTACVGQMIVDAYDFACPFCRGDPTYALLEEELVTTKEQCNAQ